MRSSFLAAALTAAVSAPATWNNRVDFWLRAIAPRADQKWYWYIIPLDTDLNNTRSYYLLAFSVDHFYSKKKKKINWRLLSRCQRHHNGDECIIIHFKMICCQMATIIITKSYPKMGIRMARWWFSCDIRFTGLHKGIARWNNNLWWTRIVWMCRRQA